MQRKTLQILAALMIIIALAIALLVHVSSNNEPIPEEPVVLITPKYEIIELEVSEEPKPSEEPTPEPSLPPEPQPITAADWYGVAYEELDERLKSVYIPTVAEVDRLTRTMGYTKWSIGEYIGYDPVQIAAVPWCICNRPDNGGFGSSFTKIITTGQFHAYNSSTPIDQRLKEFAIDVITRWLNEKLGFTDVGRILPAEFLYFSGTGKVNVYRTMYRSRDPQCIKWNWSLPSPYES